MASRESHLQQWKHNRTFVGLISSEYPDSIVTATFYTALHAVGALLAHDKITVTCHEERNRILGKTHKYSAISKSYEILYGLSRTVRYLADPKAWILPGNIESGVQAILYKIEKSVFNLLGDSSDRPKIVLTAKPSD